MSLIKENISLLLKKYNFSKEKFSDLNKHYFFHEVFLSNLTLNLNDKKEFDKNISLIEKNIKCAIKQDKVNLADKTEIFNSSLGELKLKGNSQLITLFKKADKEFQKRSYLLLTNLTINTKLNNEVVFNQFAKQIKDTEESNKISITLLDNQKKDTVNYPLLPNIKKNLIVDFTKIPKNRVSTINEILFYLVNNLKRDLSLSYLTDIIASTIGITKITSGLYQDLSKPKEYIKLDELYDNKIINHIIDNNNIKLINDYDEAEAPDTETSIEINKKPLVIASSFEYLIELNKIKKLCDEYGFDNVFNIIHSPKNASMYTAIKKHFETNKEIAFIEYNFTTNKYKETVIYKQNNDINEIILAALVYFNYCTPAYIMKELN